MKSIKKILIQSQIILIISTLTASSPSSNDQLILQSDYPTQDLGRIRPSSGSRIPSLEEASRENSLTEEDYLSLKYHLGSNQEKRLIRWSDGHQEWVTEGQKSLAILNERGRRFVDITDHHQLKDYDDDGEGGAVRGFDSDFDLLRKVQSLDILSSHPTFPEEVRIGREALSKDYLSKISTDRMRSRLEKFTSFRTRYYRSSTGRDSQAWLRKLIDSLVSASSSNVTVSEFPHSWGQNSIIVRFEPNPSSRVKDLRSTPTMIIGAHQDSTNLLPFLPAPGADDDGSGSMTILEALTIMLENGFEPKEDQGAVEFIWFSAEEGGLLGSQEIARSYKDQNRSISSMIQFDMTAFVKRGTKPTIGMVTDFVDPSLNQFLRILIEEYCSIPWKNTKCGYACSDHASFNQINVPSGFLIESEFELSNHMIHSIRDKIDVDGFSFEHMSEFVKLIIGFLFENY